jgi:hypothetical protein
MAIQVKLDERKLEEMGFLQYTFIEAIFLRRLVSYGIVLPFANA